MKKATLALVLTFVLLVSSGMVATQASAEPFKFKLTSYITKVEAIPVGDVKGHSVVLYERRGLAIFEDGECAAYLTCGTGDFTKGQGPFQGYTQLTYKDGSKTFSNYQGTLTIAPGEKMPSLTGKGEFIKGTGRFEGIKGDFSYIGKYITPSSKETKGDQYTVVSGNRTVPSK